MQIIITIIIRDVDWGGLSSFFDCERMPALESRFVMLLTRFDLDIVSWRGRLVGLLDLNISSKRKVAVRLSIWIWFAVWQVC